MIHHRVAHPETAFHPQAAQTATSGDLLRNPRDVTGGHSLRKSVLIPVQHPDLLGAHGVQQEGGMAGHQQLGTLRRRPALLGKLRQEARIQEVLRLLDPDEAWRLRIMQHRQVRQHLHGAIGRKP